MIISTLTYKAEQSSCVVVSEEKSEVSKICLYMIVQAHIYGAFVFNGKGKGKFVLIHAMDALVVGWTCVL